jgi:hypothetical protein
MDNKGTVSLEDYQPELPPAFVQLRGRFGEARKTLLKDPAYADPKQLRQFIAQFLFPMLADVVTMFGGAYTDIYALTASNTVEMNRVRQTLSAGGAAPSDAAPAAGNVDLDDLNDLQKAFFTLGSVVQRKGDAETVEAYNGCAAALSAFVGHIMGDVRLQAPDEGDESGEGEAASDEPDAAQGDA